jgi:O-succinylbenzoic acid--CoA ligase
VYTDKCPIAHDLHTKLHLPALIDNSTVITYAVLHEKINEAARILENGGVHALMRVAFIAKNHLNTIIALFALSRVAATACPLSTRLPQEVIPTRLQELSADFFLDIDLFSLTPCCLKRKTHSTSDQAIFSLLFTSGSSAKPKVVAHSVDNFLFSALGTNDALDFCHERSWLLSLPLFHVGGIAILFRVFLAGASVVLSDLPLIDAIGAHKISHLSLVPTQLYRLIHAPSTPQLKTLQTVLIGGGMLSQDLFEKAINQGISIAPTYGMTEMSSQITMLSSVDKGGILSSGSTLPYRDLTLSQEGEILVKGKTLFLGYWDGEKQKIQRPLYDGWFRTHDIGRMDDQGNLHVMGRRDSMFISGGENIHPETIERQLLNIPGIIQAFILPINDAEYGHRPIAFIQQEPFVRYTAEQINEILQTKLPKFYCPKMILDIPERLLKDLKVSKTSLYSYLHRSMVKEG